MDPLYEEPILYAQHWDEGLKEEDLDLKAQEVRLEKITDPQVRAKIFDMYVSYGRDGIILAQRCVGAVEDGGVDDITLTLWNSNTPGDLLFKLSNVSLAYEELKGVTEESELRARALGQIDSHMPLGLTSSLKEKIHEQVSTLKQHGRWFRPSPKAKGQRPQRSGVDKGEADKT